MKNLDFVKQFYSLEGDLISERKKNLFKLLKAQTTPITEEDLNGLHPRTYLERLFQIEIFIYFKIFPKLLDVLKNGNNVFVTKILKRPKILKEAIENIPPERFVNDFLPCTSFTVRMKILRRVCVFLEESRMDEIISLVYVRYGFNIAIQILHMGSFQKIKQFVHDHDVLFTSRQMKFMFNKDPELLVIYLNRHKASTGIVYTHCYLSAYVALKNPSIWLRLQKDHMLSFASLGYRTSRSFIRYNRKDFLNNIKSYSIFLKLSSIVRELYGCFKDVYVENFPKDINNISLGNFCHKLLRYYPKKKQWLLFSQTFKKIYGKNIMDNLNYLKYGFIQQFADKTIINEWAKKQFIRDQSNYILTFCEPTMAISLIQEKISVTADLSDKTELLILMLENSAENENLDSLGEALKYIYKYINENKDVKHLYGVASLTLHKIVSSFKLEQLNENHWIYINEIIAFTRRRKQIDYYSFTDVFTIILKNIEYLCQNERPFRKELIKFIEEVDSNSSWFHIDLKNPKVEQQIWTEIINVYPDVVSSQYKTLKKQEENFIMDIIHFNEKNPEYSIDLSNFPSLLTYITSIFHEDTKKLGPEDKTIMKKVIYYNLKFANKPIIDIKEAHILKIFRDNKKDFCYETFLEKLITKHQRTKFENDVLQLFWENLSEFHYLNKRILHWLFINEPRTVLPHFEHILTVDKKFVDVYYIKLVSHLGFDKKLIDYCMCKLEALNICKGPVKRNVFDKKVEINIDTEVIEMLAVLLPANKFIENVVNRFLPDRDARETNELLYLLQCEVARSLRRIEEPGAVIGILMRYCVDDYLQCTLPSLYSICYRAPEEALYTYLDNLFDISALTRKHALFLSCELLGFNYVFNMLQNANENGISGKRYVFTAILKYFRKNPSEDLLNMVVANLSTIDKDDKGILNCIAITEIPKKYTDMYIQKCWHFFENVRKKEVSVQTYLQLVLDSIMRSETLLTSLSQDFCRHVITHYFRDSPQRDHCLGNVGRFVCMFLIFQTSEQEYNFEFVFDIISRFKMNNSIDLIKIFFNNFYDFAVEDVQNKNIIDSNNNYHIELFKQCWLNMFTPIEMFDEHVLLNLLYLQCKATENLIENYAREISVYVEELVAEYGPYIYYKLKNLLLVKNPLTEKEKYVFLHSLLEFKNSTLNCILVIDLLDSCSFDNETKRIYFQILDILKSSDDPVVAIYLHSSFGCEL